MVQTYLVNLNNPYLGNKVVGITAKDEVGARAVACRLNKGYTIQSVEVQGTRPEQPGNINLLDIEDDTEELEIDG